MCARHVDGPRERGDRALVGMTTHTPRERAQLFGVALGCALRRLLEHARAFFAIERDVLARVDLADKPVVPGRELVDPPDDAELVLARALDREHPAKAV